MFNFNFSEKSLELLYPPHFVYDFSRKHFLVLHFINWPKFIVWLPSLLEILGNMCITIVCKLGCHVRNFVINLIFLIKPFCYMTKKSRQKFKYLENKKSFWGEIKSIFHYFQRAFNCQKWSQTWESVFDYYWKALHLRCLQESCLRLCIKWDNVFKSGLSKFFEK